jgi:hypothetical protein
MLGPAMTQVVRCWLFTAEAQVQCQPVHLEFVVDRVEQGQVFLPLPCFSSVGIILPVVHALPFVTMAI